MASLRLVTYRPSTHSPWCSLLTNNASHSPRDTDIPTGLRSNHNKLTLCNLPFSLVASHILISRIIPCPSRRALDARLLQDARRRHALKEPRHPELGKHFIRPSGCHLTDTLWFNPYLPSWHQTCSDDPSSVEPPMSPTKSGSQQVVLRRGAAQRLWSRALNQLQGKSAIRQLQNLPRYVNCAESEYLRAHGHDKLG